MRAKHKVYLDCEFMPNDLTNRGTLSIGLADNFGYEMYLVNGEADWSVPVNHPWMKAHVMPFIPMINRVGTSPRPDETHSLNNVRTIDEMQRDVEGFFSKYDRHDTVVYAWCGGQDIVRLQGLWNHDWAIMPDCIPHWLQDLEGLLEMHEIDQELMPPLNPDTVHHPLYDALHDMAVHQTIEEILKLREETQKTGDL